MKLFDSVSMVGHLESDGWIKELRPDRYGVPCALVVWEHHNGVRALIPVRKLQVTEPAAAAAAAPAASVTLPCRYCHFDVPIAVYREQFGYCGEDCAQAASSKYRTNTRGDLQR